MGRQPPWLRLLGVIAFIGLIVVAAIAFRYKTTVVNSAVLVMDRWTDHAVLVHENGKVDYVEDTRPVGRRFPLSSKRLTRWGTVTVRARAVWRWGKSHALVVVNPVPEEMQQARMNEENFFHLAFVDRNGFTIYQFDVPLYKMHAITDEAGNVLALEYRKITSLPRRHFKAIRRWLIR